MTYAREEIRKGVFVTAEEGRDYRRPAKAVTFAFDTETQVYFDGRILTPKALFKKIKGMKQDEIRKRVSSVTWAYQAYDEINGFFMTNDFEEFITYCCRAGYKFGWVYNATFDFSQIDFQILAEGRGKWKPHEKRTGGAYDKGQAYTYESLHSDMGARYAYKLWFPYRNRDGHDYVHAVEFRDFMKFCVGGLASVLENLDVRDNEGNPCRKLTMDYQAVRVDELTDDEIAYCAMDVKGLYFAVKKFNSVVELLSAGECSIFGKGTNLMTAGGFAKRMLLKSLYPNKTTNAYRVQAFQKQHPITPRQDEFLRANHLYRGGITFVNPAYKGKLLTERLYRYDVNSEYPFIMSQIWDLIGKPIRKTYEEWEAMTDEEKDNYECIYALTSVSGHVKKDYLGVWYDPFRRSFVDFINEEGTHLIFEREFVELSRWYDDMEFSIDYVLLCRRGGRVYAPFIEGLYEMKADAKKAGNVTLLQAVKLLLNSSYGKLAERLTRVIGNYELNEETGAIHFVRAGEETDASKSLSVLIGALVTASARVFILSKIREICAPHKGGIRRNFVYIDTDSVHSLVPYDKADAYALGGLKLEAVCDACKYVLPKTYIDVERVNPDGTIDLPDKKGKGGGFEVHCKGINTASFVTELRKKQKGKRKGKATLPLIDRKMNYGEKYIVLVAMNVRGGKALLPTEKFLARFEQAPKGDGETYYTNYNGQGYLTEI